MKIIVSGFNAFAGDTDNPSEEVVKRLKRDSRSEQRGDVELIVLPTEFGRSSEILINAIDRGRPDLAVMLGYHAGSEHVLLERFALNIIDCDIADNAGVKFANWKIQVSAPDALKTSVDPVPLGEAMSASGIPSRVSNYAGTYVCNFVYFSVLQHLRETGAKCKALFVHIPPEAALRPDPVSGAEPWEASVFALESLLRALRTKPGTAASEKIL